MQFFFYFKECKGTTSFARKNIRILLRIQRLTVLSNYTNLSDIFYFIDQLTDR